MKTEKLIELVKRSYFQPIIFHTLMNHISAVMKTENPIYKMKDDWSKIIIYSAIPNKISNQGMESKILKLLKKLRKDKFGKEANLKIMIILYYLKNRPIAFLNHMAILELVSYFFGISDFIDGMILSILSIGVNAIIYKIPISRKLTNDSVLYMLKIISNTKFSQINNYIALTIFVQQNLVYKISDIDLQTDLLTFLMLEYLCFYAKYSKYEENVRTLIPQNELFISILNKYINKEQELIVNSTNISLKVTNKEMFYRLKHFIDKSDDREKIKNDLIDFISNL